MEGRLFEVKYDGLAVRKTVVAGIPDSEAPLMQVVLVMFRQDGERRSFSITRDVTVIGRREDCDFRIPLGEVSRKHCRLIKDGSSLRLEDLGSSNGSFRNGERVQEAELNPGDTLQVGPVIFVLQIDGVPADDELQPVVNAPEEAPAETPTEAGAHLEPAGHSADEPTNGEFDPMAILEGDSDIAPAIDESAVGEAALDELDAQDSSAPDQKVQQD
jgi:predicted component of type VI protein secretion system